MDALRQQVIALTEELTVVKTELVNVKAAHANLHQQTSESNAATAKSFAEQRSRFDTIETQMGSGKSGTDKKPLIEPKQVEVHKFQGAMSESRAKFLEWSELVKDRVGLYEAKTVDGDGCS